MAENVTDEKDGNTYFAPEQLDLFTDCETLKAKRKKETEAMEKARRMQEAVLSIKRKFGKNALLRGLDFAEGATAKERNNRIGGHNA